MKHFAKLFILGVALLSSGSVMADIVDGVRTKPAPQGSYANYELDQNYYLYHAATGQFFAAGNDWNTRASISEIGQIVYFIDSENALEYGENVVEIKNFVPKFGSFYSVFSQGPEDIWTDSQNMEGCYWTITKGSTGYRISNVMYEDLFLGVDYSKNDTRLYLIPAVDSTAAADWQLVTPDNYEAYRTALDSYHVAETLRDYIAKGITAGADVSGAQQVYLNEQASVEQLQEAIQDVIDALSQIDGQAVNVTDLYITNPSYANNDNEGWSGTVPAFQSYDNAEFFYKSFDYYQDLSGLKPGVYALGLQAFYRSGSLGDSYDAWINGTDLFADLYVEINGVRQSVPLMNIYDGAGTVGLGVGQEIWRTNVEPLLYNPNNMLAAQGYFQAGRYHNTLFFTVSDSASVRIGLYKENLKSNDWTMFDNWTLTYYGSGDAAYSQMVAAFIEQSPSFNDAIVTKSLLEDYRALCSNPSATTAEEAEAYIQALIEAQVLINENIGLWNQYQTKVESAKTFAYQLLEEGKTGSQLDLLIAYAENEAVNIISSCSYSNEELLAEIEKVDAQMEAVQKEAKESVQAGDDVTSLLVNPGFEDGTNGWTIISAGGGNVVLGGNADNHCFEAWHSTNFDVYQEVSNLPVGVYEVTVNGFVRYRDGQDAIYAQGTEPEDVPIYVYMNDSKTNFVNWFSYPKPAEFYNAVSGAGYLMDDEGNCYPDNMVAASAVFLDGGYQQSAKLLVSEAGTVTRIGVKGTPIAMFWPIFDNFRLTYLGMDAELVEPLLRQQMDIAYKKQYVRSSRSAHQMIVDALANAEASIQNADGNAMFAAISSLEKAINAVDETNPLMEAYREAIYGLELEISSSSNAQVIKEAGDFAYAQYEAIDNYQIEVSELDELYSLISEYRSRLRIPAYDYASAESPVDMTSVIMNPGFDLYGYNNLAGWNVSGNFNFGNDQSQRDALALEFYESSFDINQTISGLPEGWYQVRVNAFLRGEWDMNSEDYANLAALLYAASSQDYNQKAIRQKNESNVGFDVYNMVSSVEAFDYGFFENRLNVYVGSDGTLTLGMIKSGYTTYDWVLLDNWQLIYTGKDQISDENPADPDPVFKTESKLYIDGYVALSKGQQGVLPISMSNDTDILGLQFDVELPEGMTFVQRSTRLNGDRIYDHALSSNVLADGTVRMMVTSLSNSPIYDYDGVLVNLALNIPADMPVGDYAVTLKNIVLTNSDKETINCSDMTFYVSVAGKMGDVNSDDEINVTDVVMIIEHILGRYPQNFSTLMADVNRDSWIDVTDAVMVIDAILDNVTLSRGTEAVDRTAYTAFQMDLTIPAGYVLEGVELTEMAKRSHTLAYNVLADGRCRVVVCSMDNAALPGAWNEVINLKLRGQGEPAIAVDDAVFVTIAGERHELTFGTTTGIASLSTHNSQLPSGYDLQGRRVEKTAKGIVVENGKKLIKK